MPFWMNHTVLLSEVTGTSPGALGVQFVFRHHPLGVAGEQVLAGRGDVVADEQGGLVAADGFTAVLIGGWSRSREIFGMCA